MIDVEPLIRIELDRELPLPSGERADWSDVLLRSGLTAGSTRSRRFRWRRSRVAALALAIAAAAVVAVASPVRSAILEGFDGFSAWLTGQPGTPASSGEQQAFEDANARSWTGFPPGTELRHLITTRVGDTTFTLFGFRSGDLLCLRLVASGAVSKTSSHCAPVSALQQTTKPAVVFAADEPFGDDVAPALQGFKASLAAATFGIASDGVAGIAVHGDDGVHQAQLGSNAFLYLDEDPKLGTRVRAVEAIAANGERVGLPFQSAPFDTIDLPQPPKGSPQGPATADRTVHGGSITWLDKREPRGEPIPGDVATMLSRRWDILFGRVLRPDPSSSDRVVLMLVDHQDVPPGMKHEPGPAVCTFVGSSDHSIGGGCSPVGKLFDGAPLTFGMGGSGADQFTRLNGLASDDVAALKVFLADGDVMNVPLKDNTYLTYVSRAAFPIRLVAYDSTGKSIYVQTVRDDGMTNPAPLEARKSMRERFTVTADDGTKATAVAGDPAGGYRCWTIRYGDNGAEGGGCTPWPLTPKLTLGNPLNLIGAQASGPNGAMFLGGQVPEEITRIVVSFRDGTTAEARTESSLTVYPVPTAELRKGAVSITLRGYDKSGAEVAARTVSVRR
jgi:hypothetical protein